ncbi:putative major facilitator, sugar transporter, major facilitator superfamily [Helianthus anomalus]
MLMLSIFIFSFLYFHHVARRGNLKLLLDFQVAVAVTLALKFGQGVELPKGVGIFLVVTICIFVFAYWRLWGPLSWLVPSELFPLQTRSAGQSIVVCVNMFFTALIAQCFLVSLCYLRYGPYGIFLLFAALMGIMTCFIYFLLPETNMEIVLCTRRPIKRWTPLSKGFMPNVDCDLNYLSFL